MGLVLLCRGHLEEKYRYLFRLIADPERKVDQRKLGLLLHDCIQVSLKDLFIVILKMLLKFVCYFPGSPSIG